MPYDNLQRREMRPEAKLKTSGSPCWLSFDVWMIFIVMLLCWTIFVTCVLLFLMLFLVTITWHPRAPTFLWIHLACKAPAWPRRFVNYPSKHMAFHHGRPEDIVATSRHLTTWFDREVQSPDTPSFSFFSKVTVSFPIVTMLIAAASCF